MVTWTDTDYPFASASSVPSIITGAQRWTVLLVPSDGTETAITFPSAFASIPGTIIASIRNPIGSGQYALGDPQVDSVTTTGFNVYVPGGPPRSTVTLNFTAIL